jgi:hypothetical protein
MLGVLVEGMRKVVRGLGIILMDILSEVDPEVFGSLEESKDVNEKQNLIFETSSNKKMPIKNENNPPWDYGFLYGLWGLPIGRGLYWYSVLYDDNDD